MPVRSAGLYHASLLTYRLPALLPRVRREVAPERIGFSEELTGGIAYWCANFAALYQLWLDPGVRTMGRRPPPRPGRPGKRHRPEGRI